MKRFSCFAFGKNSTYLMPQWWQIIAKHAAVYSWPYGVVTFMKPQSIWKDSPGPVVYRCPRLPWGAISCLLAGTKDLWEAMYRLTVLRLPVNPHSFNLSRQTTELVTPCFKRLSKTEVYPSRTECGSLRPEAFHRSVIPAVPFSAHTTDKAILFQGTKTLPWNTG